MASRLRRLVPVALAAIVVATLGTTSRSGPLAAPTADAAIALPTTEISSAAVTSAGAGRTDVFTRSSAGHLVHQYRLPGGSWTRPIDLGGSLASQPAAASWEPGRLDVFARGTDNLLWHRWYTAGRWSAWEKFGGTITSAPTVAAWGPGRLDVFARGAGDALYHKWFVSGQGWYAWQNLGGVISSSPSATSWGARRLDVFARGGGNGIYHKRFTGTAWTSWARLGGTATSQPAAASPGTGRLDVTMRGTDGAMWLRSWSSASGWTAWASLGGRFTSGPGAMAAGDDVRIVGRSSSGYVIESVRASPTSAWSAWTRVDQYLPFRRMATWVDVFDYATLDPETAVPDMRSRGVRVLFLATARFNGTSDFYDAAEAGRWLDLAHQNGIKVVGWYLPAYGDLARDVRRTVAIARFVSPGGQRFDAVGVDIERLDEVSLNAFHWLAVAHLTQVRAQTHAMIGAIVPSPFATDPGSRWAGFPWPSVGTYSDVVVPMALWSFRSNADGSAFTPDQVYAWVLDQVQRARSLGGRPVTVEGGVDDPGTERTPVTADRVSRFVDAAIAGGAIGGSHYDYATTPAALWAILARLNGL